MPNIDYIPVQDLSIKNTLADTDYIPVSDGSTAYAVRGATLKEYAEEAAETTAGTAVAGFRSEINVRSESIESDLQKMTGSRPLTFIPGCYRTASTTGTGETAYFVSSDTRVCAIAPCSAGDVVYGHIIGPTGTSRGVYFVDSSMKVLYRATANYEFNGSMTAPANSAYVILNNVLASLPSGYYGYVGDAINSRVSVLDRKVSALSGHPENLVSLYGKLTEGNGYIAIAFADTLPAGEYSCYLNVSTTNSGVQPYFSVFTTANYNASEIILTKRIENGKSSCFRFEATEPFRSIRVMSASTPTASASYSMTVTGTIEIYGGEYVKNDGATDVTRIIREILAASKYCKLPTGAYLISNLVMPGESILCGDGGATLYFDENADGAAIMMGTRCTVKDLTLFGDDEDIILPPSDFEPEIGSTNYLAGISPNISNGWLQYVFSTPLSAGSYRLKMNISTTNTGVMPYVKTLDQSSYGADHVIETARITNGEETWLTLRSEVPIASIFVFSAVSVSSSANYTITVDEASEIYSLTQLVGYRHGIAWQEDNESAEDKEFGRISNCRIERFTGSGIRSRDTGTPVDNNLAVSDCFIRNCVVGVYIQRNSEFLKISNNTIVRNWYGVLNRGGNNNISNCGIDGNVVGIGVDQDEGQNNGHGAITGCSINHSGGNTGYGLVIKDTGRMIVSNCNMYYGKIKLESTNGNVISNCGFGRNAGVEIVNGQCSLLTNCMVMTGEFTITRENNTAAKVINCFTRSGEAVTG